MINRSASPFPVSPARQRRLPTRTGYTAFAVALPLAFALGGCGNKGTDPATQARLDALEKKVDAADKRSHQAISLAMQPMSAPPVDAGDAAQFDDGPIDSAPQNFGGEDQDGIPASPALGPEG